VHTDQSIIRALRRQCAMTLNDKIKIIKDRMSLGLLNTEVYYLFIRTFRQLQKEVEDMRDLLVKNHMNYITDEEARTPGELAILASRYRDAVLMDWIPRFSPFSRTSVKERDFWNLYDSKKPYLACPGSSLCTVPSLVLARDIHSTSNEFDENNEVRRIAILKIFTQHLEGYAYLSREWHTKTCRVCRESPYTYKGWRHQHRVRMRNYGFFLTVLSRKLPHEISEEVEPESLVRDF